MVFKKIRNLLDLRRDVFTAMGDGAEFKHLLKDAVVESMAGFQGQVSSRCINDTSRLLVGMIEGKHWALLFFDAAGKPGAGISHLKINFVGDYDLCRSLEAPPGGTSEGFRGSYCVVKAIYLPPAYFEMLSITNPLEWGLCVPSSCNETENTIMFSKGRVLLSIFGCLIVSGTLYDIVYVQMPVWKIQSAESERLSSNGAPLGHGKSQDLRAIGDYGSLNPRKESTERTPSHTMGSDGIVIRAVLVFSIYTNGRKLLDTKEGTSSIRCLHGIRFFSMAWVLLSHFFTFGANMAINAYSKSHVWNDRWIFKIVVNAAVSTDTFFLMSGLLVSFSTLRQLKSKGWKINWVRFYLHRYWSGLLVSFSTLRQLKSKGWKINWVRFYLHRYWRLTPSYMMVLLLTLGLQQYCGEGANWPKSQTNRDASLQCSDFRRGANRRRTVDCPQVAVRKSEYDESPLGVGSSFI
ncbi:hypothetical protein EGW08_018322 [Elysia chlorotica]|uniref:Nose resistant-to-fluoxetine protein N-terminal domain-containing protein n=1 Tax=Elysia chlorotica TaxID=188477 RepID=A0A3S0Z9Q4_ELYCH|nr:hypothetical protein EGW08_018322 [Elysia chlorotica]